MFPPRFDYENNDVNTIYHVSDVRFVSIFEDIPDAQDWTTRTKTFDENGALIDVSLIPDAELIEF